jgi:hypothetical protein
VNRPTSVGYAATLWKPFESELGVSARMGRFGHTFNSAVNLQDVTGQAPLPGHSMTPYQHKCLEGIMRDSSIALRDEQLSLTCPKCETIRYHSWVYHHLWLSHCPIHHCPFEHDLFYTSLYRRYFESRIDLHATSELRKGSSLAPTIFKALFPIVKFIKSTIPATPVTLYAYDDSELDAGLYSCTLRRLKPSNDEFASAAIHMCPKLAGYLHNISYRSAHYHSVTFTQRGKQHVEPRASKTRRSCIIKSVLPKIDRALVRMLQKNRPRLKLDDNELRSTPHKIENWMDPEFEAYKVWRSLTSFCQTSPPYCGGWLVGDRLFRDCGGTPLIPIPLIYLDEGDRENFLHKWQIKSPLASIPAELSEYLFTLDCIACYHTILGYFNHRLSVKHWRAKLWSQKQLAPVGKMPKALYPNVDFRPDLYVVKQNENFRVLIPNRLKRILNRPEFSELQLVN